MTDIFGGLQYKSGGRFLRTQNNKTNRKKRNFQFPIFIELNNALIFIENFINKAFIGNCKLRIGNFLVAIVVIHMAIDLFIVFASIVL